jgi:hypothetical protein
MAYLTPESAVSISSAGANTVTSAGTLLTSGATNTKGSWTQLSASLPGDIVGVWLNFQAPNSYRYFLDLAVGAGYTVVINDLYLVTRANMGVPGVFLPLALPAGEPLYARVSSASATRTVSVAANFVLASCNTSRPYARGVTLGATVASTSGVTIDPGASANTKGAWTQIANPTGYTIRSLLIAVGQGYDTYPAAYGTQGWLIDVGVGSAGSEVVLIPNLPACSDSSSDTINQHWYGPFDVTIPAASRIAIRCQCSVNTANVRLLRFTVTGFD